MTLLRKSWPLTAAQWQFVEQLKEQEKNDLKSNRQLHLSCRIDRFIVFLAVYKPPATKADGTAGGAAGGAGAGGKRTGQAAGAAAAGKGKGATATTGASKGSTTTTGRPGTGKAAAEKPLDTSKAHWILRVVCDADKTVRTSMRSLLTALDFV